MIIDDDVQINFETQNLGHMLFENLRQKKFQDMYFSKNYFFNWLKFNEIKLLSIDLSGLYIKDNDYEEAE